MSNLIFSISSTSGDDRRPALEQVLQAGNLSAGGGSVGTSVVLTSGTTTLTIAGAGLALTNVRTLSAGTISSLTLSIGGTTVMTLSGFTVAPTVAQVNALLAAYDQGDEVLQWC